jgi:hypothetical protein
MHTTMECLYGYYNKKRAALCCEIYFLMFTKILKLNEEVPNMTQKLKPSQKRCNLT